MSEKELSFTAEVQSQGKITIPISTRKALELSEGDLVQIKIVKVSK